LESRRIAGNPQLDANGAEKRLVTAECMEDTDGRARNRGNPRMMAVVIAIEEFVEPSK